MSQGEKHTRYMRDIRCGTCMFDFKTKSEIDDGGAYCCYGDSSFSFYCEKCYKQYNIEANIKYNNINYRFEKIEESLNKLLKK